MGSPESETPPCITPSSFQHILILIPVGSGNFAGETDQAESQVVLGCDTHCLHHRNPDPPEDPPLPPPQVAGVGILLSAAVMR